MFEDQKLKKWDKAARERADLQTQSGTTDQRGIFQV